MSIVFHYAPMSSATPVACALSELGVPHERVTHDLSSSAHATPEFLALNPNGKVPTLVVDGTPLFEALAIIQWLGERFGVQQGLWPAADSPARLEALSWSTWAYVTYGAQLVRIHLADETCTLTELRNDAHVKHAREEAAKLAKLLEARLATRAYLLGDHYSLCDLVVSGVVGYGTFCGASIDSLPQVTAWLERCQNRPRIRAEWNASAA